MLRLVGRVSQTGDRSGCWRDAFAQNLTTEHGVDEGRFAGVELTDDNQQEELVEVQLGLAQLCDGFGRGWLGQEELTQASECRALVAHELTCVLADHRSNPLLV